MTTAVATPVQAVQEPEVERVPPVETNPVAAAAPRVELPPGPRAYIQTFKRLTAIFGMLALVAGLAVWRFEPHSQHRLALLIFVGAMFLAILHHYSLEEHSLLTDAS